MLAAPAPLMSHSLDGFPDRLFSQTIGFDPQLCACGLDPVLSATPSKPRSMSMRFNTFSCSCETGEPKAQSRRRTTRPAGSDIKRTYVPVLHRSRARGG